MLPVYSSHSNYMKLVPFFVSYTAIILCVLTVPLLAMAQQVHQDLQETVRATVVSIDNEFERRITGTDATATVQELTIEVREGERAGELVTIDNDLVLLKPGDAIIVNRLEFIDGTELFVFKDAERRGYLLGIFILLVGLVLWFAGKKGIRALVSLGLSITAIFFVLVPALLAGYSPAWVSLGVSVVVLALILFLTHGINPRSMIAFSGTVTAIFLTCAIAAFWVSSMRLTGFGSDASVYLNFATSGALDFSGLLLGSMIIGLLGVLDDVSITQASVVQELRAANNKLGFVELYQRAIRVGRDHVGSLVNTLALAYVGAALPIVLLFSAGGSSFLMTVNQEVVAAEILRIIVGSIGLILTVPLTTGMAAWYFKDKDVEGGEPVACGHVHKH